MTSDRVDATGAGRHPSRGPHTYREQVDKLPTVRSILPDHPGVPVGYAGTGPGTRRVA